MAGEKKTTKGKRKIRAYTHEDKERLNNPPVGLVTPDTDKDAPKKIYEYDPHLDPSLQWTGKTENLSFEVPTVSLHVHERIDPYTIIQSAKKKNDNGNGNGQISLFEQEAVPLREAIEFYKHKSEWSNRLIAGDSLLVMNSLLEKEGMAGQVQMAFIDPPYGIKYGSNFQPFVNKRDVKDGRDEDLTGEPETLKAFRDTWELGVHSYLTYMRDRLLLTRELLSDSGSCFVQIDDGNIHHLKELMDEIFGAKNFISLITFKTGSGFSGNYLKTTSDYLLWYAKDKSKTKYRQLYLEKSSGVDSYFDKVKLLTGEVKNLSQIKKIPDGSRFLCYRPLVSGSFSASTTFEYIFNGKKYHPGANRCWKTTKSGLDNLVAANRIYASENTLKFIVFHDDFSLEELTHVWIDTIELLPKKYIVQTTTKVLQRCILMTTDPGDLIFDPTCGSGTSAYVAEQWGRRWITCDTSRVALALARKRVMTATFDYYGLAYPDEGIGSGFIYKKIPHVTLKSIANNEPPDQEISYDLPEIDRMKVRVTGPFTVEAVPAPVVMSLDCNVEAPANDASVSRSGETLRQAEWEDELFKTGIRGKGGQRILFSRVESLSGTRYLHADAETKEDEPQRVVISFGPEHTPLEQRQVALAIEEAQSLVPKPKIIVFTAFQFDPEAAKDIDETNWPGVTLLKVQMNADLLTADLKKKKSSNESFWLVGQPDIDLRKNKDGTWQVEVLGFDYYNTKTGILESGGSDKIAMWMLDHDYDGRSLFPHQVFFPISSEKDGWSKLAKNLKAEIDEDKIQAYSSAISLPFAPGEHQRIAVKIIDDRGIESLKILKII
ncbi:MAG TPA: site-specific DNA-methyltransferase [Gammaproteobacteria bacterium]|nr:site-specific DNA-methyltransferase [Gammaproteobacteria bacterium]